MASVEEQSVPVGIKGFVVSHAGYNDCAGFSLFFHVADCFHSPVGVFSADVRVLFDGDCVGWTKSHAALAVNTVLVFAANVVSFRIVAVGLVGALVNAYFAAYAPFFVSFNEVFRHYIGFHYFEPPGLFLSLQTTGSPPLGHQNLSMFGETNRMAHSSEDMYW